MSGWMCAIKTTQKLQILDITITQAFIIPPQKTNWLKPINL